MSGTHGARWLWLSLGVLAADRATKFAIERYTNAVLPPSDYFGHRRSGSQPESRHRVRRVFRFQFAVACAALIASSAAVMVLLVWLLVTGRAGGALAQSGLALILGGAAGNALDRLIHGGVTDFLEVRLWKYIWPAFNVADSAITIGAVLVLIELLFGARQRQIPTAEKR